MKRCQKARLWTALCLIGLALLICGTVSADGAVWPSTGKTQKKSSKLIVDVSNMNDGYVMAAVNKKNKNKLKLRVIKDGETLTYDLNGNGDFEVFPLQLGNGKYEISLYENVSGKKYSQAGKVSISVKLNDENAPFLVPNQYVHYTALSEAVEKAMELCAGKSEDEKYQIVCNFMKSAFMYDYVKAVTIKAGQLPDIDGSYAKKMGVCQDLSAIMVCMLRTQGVPARLIIGYADKNYHAWTTTSVGGEEKFFDPTAALNAITQVKSYSMERYY